MTNRPTASRRRTWLAFWATTRPRPTSNLAWSSSRPRKYDLAVKALERGLVYDEDNSQIALASGRHPDQAQQEAIRHWPWSSGISSVRRRLSNFTSSWPGF